MSGAVLPSLPMPRPGTYVDGDKVAADMDSNGWPAAKRDDVLRILQRCSAFHIAGDQHLATVVRHGIDEFGDAGFSFTGPALNNIWPRRWWPPREDRQAPLDPQGPEYTGDFFDGFGNRVTVHASANPRATGLQPAILHDRVTGYGIVIFDKANAQITMECWPRHVDPSRADARQFEDWPITIDGGQRGWAYSARAPSHGSRTWTGRRCGRGAYRIGRTRLHAAHPRFGVHAPVFEPGSHVVRVGDPDSGSWLERTVEQGAWGAGELDFDFIGLIRTGQPVEIVVVSEGMDRSTGHLLWSPVDYRFRPERVRAYRALWQSPHRRRSAVSLSPPPTLIR